MGLSEGWQTVYFETVECKVKMCLSGECQYTFEWRVSDKMGLKGDVEHVTHHSDTFFHFALLWFKINSLPSSTQTHFVTIHVTF